MPTATYRAPDFVRAAKDLGVDLIVGSEVAPPYAAPGRAIAVPLDDPTAAATLIESLDRDHAVDAVVAVDDQGVIVAATTGERMGFPHNPPDAVAATRDKAALRARLAAAEVPQPRFGSTPDAVGYPCVVKPTQLAGSQGVIRCDSPAEFDAAVTRIRAFWPGELIVEEYIPGVEVGVEAILRAGELTVLAIFDKPDPLVGPYFEETIYVTPSRLAAATQRAVIELVARAAAGIGLTEGPVHAEVRVDGDRCTLIEVAARTIGGLCARTLRFGAGISLEEVVLRHALGMEFGDLRRATTASGVMMLPIPRAGTLRAVDHRERALAVPGIVDLDITIPIGAAVVPLPEGDRYLGFLFATGASPVEVETSLRAGAAGISIVID